MIQELKDLLKEVEEAQEKVKKIFREMKEGGRPKKKQENERVYS